MTNGKNSPDITRTTLAVLFIGILISTSFWIMRPFLTATVWAGMIVITTWTIMLWLEKALRGKRSLAVLAMTMVLLLLLVIPLTLAIVSIIGRADEIAAWTKSLATLEIPPPPEWVGNLPMAGQKISEQWLHLAATGKAELAAKLEPYLAKAASWLLAQAGNIMMMVVQFLLTVIISAVLYATGETAAAGICRFARRLGGQNGEDAAILAAKAVRGVALGVVVTALVQSGIGGAGLFLAGVPGAAILTAVIFILCVAQIGPALVVIPSVIWLFWQDQSVWGTVMIGFGLVACTVDNFIRPFLIKKGADLPLLLIFAGVLGGLVAFDVIGLFIGPVVLAVTYTLLEAWIKKDELPLEEPVANTPEFQ